MKHNVENRLMGALIRRNSDAGKYQKMLRTSNESFVVDGDTLNRDDVLCKLECAEREAAVLRDRLKTLTAGQIELPPELEKEISE